jgi:hypothetical protein
MTPVPAPESKRRTVTVIVVVLAAVGLVLVGLATRDTGGDSFRAQIGSAPASSSATTATKRAGAVIAVSPYRLYDTRTNHKPLPPGGVATVVVAGKGPVPSRAAAVVLTVTVVDPNAYGYVTVWPTGQPMPVASNLNVAPKDIRSASVVVPVGAKRSVNVFSQSGGDLVVDVNAYVEPS